MKKRNEKIKRFLIPILSLVIISIIIITTISSYITINMFETHMNELIEKTKKEYTEEQKNRVKKEVTFVSDTIRFQIETIDNKLKDSLKEKIHIALDVVQHTYDTYKDKLDKNELRNKVVKKLEAIKFNNNQGYYFMYDSKTKINFGHPLKKFVGKDMTDFKDSRGQNLMQLNSKALEKNKIGFVKIYFNKPNNQKDEFPKINCLTEFKELDLVIGIGEYLDVVEKQNKEYVLKRFSEKKYDVHDDYLVILDVHNLKGGDNFATVLLTPNGSNLIGKKVSDKEKDIKGNKFRKNLLDLVNDHNEGYFSYWFKNPKTGADALKMSYFHFQKDWNWIISSGFYYEDLEKEILRMNQLITSYTNDVIEKTLTWVISLSLLSIIIAIFVSLKIDKTIKKYTNKIIEQEEDKRKQEYLFLQQNKMAAMGEMIGNIAHQWRQPLSTISTAATGTKLLKELDELSDKDILVNMDIINNSAQHLSSTINDFRDFFNPSNKEIVEFNISNTIKKTLNLIDSQFSTEDIKIIKNINNYRIFSIENELIQVLINILKNANDVLITKEKQKRFIFINTYRKDNLSYIEILDNAGGISNDIIDKIFEPYFTTKHKSIGTGIGLYMCKGIVENHLNGTINVSNEVYSYENVDYTGAKFIISIA